MAADNRQQDPLELRLHDEDLSFVRELLSDDPEVRDNAWDRFYRNLIPRMEGRIVRLSRRLSPGDVDEISGRVMSRIASDDYILLRGYEGRCSLMTYLHRPIYWEFCDHLERLGRTRMVSLDEMKERIGDLIEKRKPASDDVVYTEDQFLEDLDVRIVKKMPEVLRKMDQEKRWVVLLRYYDDSEWEFPPDEIRALAKARKVPIGEISRRLTKVFVEDNVLAKQRLEARKLLDKIARNLWPAETEQAENLNRLVEMYSRSVVKTPYKDMGYILMVDNMNTLRSRFHEALKEIKDYLIKQGQHF